MPRRGNAPDTARYFSPQRPGSVNGSSPTHSRRQSAWTGARSSPTFQPAQRPNQNNFPPLAQTNDRLIQTLSGLTGTTVTISLKDGQRYQGKISSTTTEGESAGLTLQEVKDLANANAQPKDQLFVAAANIDTWSSGPADAKLTNGSSFKTDTDISAKAPAAQRELQPWQPSSDAAPSGAASSSTFAQGDDVTFGPGANTGADWDQFAANEQLFGVTARFDESAYTTPLDRSGPDFKERERKAQRLANEINGATSSNPHLTEERNQAGDDSGVNEEDKYGAVVRGTNAYVPPGARKQQPQQKPEIPSVAVNDGTPPNTSNAPSPAPSNTSAKPTVDALPAFRDFVTNEKQRLNQKRQALQKNEMDKKVAELVRFSQNFKLNKPIPDDLVPILAKDEDKQKAIKEKASKDAASALARSIGPSTTAITNARPPAAVTKPEASRKPSGPTAGKPIAASNATSPQIPPTTPKNGISKPDSSKPPKINMVIQAIPPFKGKTRQSLQPPPRDPNGSSSTDSSKSTTPAAAAAAAAAQAAANRLNVNASSFRPKSNAFTPSTTTSPKPESPKPKDATPAAPNPFFGVRPLKKNLVNVKDDFNPFKHNKVVDPATVLTTWPYNGKRYTQMFPPTQHAPQPHPGHVPPQPPPVPPPPYEDQENRMPTAGYVYYPPYGYPGQMMPVPPPGPPGTFIPAPYLQPMPYPPGMPPNAMYAPPGMGQMPPPQAYMPPPPPPPGTYPPPPAGQPRQSMPPTPIPTHAHPYYPSPQLQHAVPYQMMMPPPPNVQHPYDGGPAPPVMNHG